jgi:amidase
MGDFANDAVLCADYCPNQDKLLSLIEASRPGEDQTARLESCKKWAATEGIDKAVSQHGVDMVVCSSDRLFAAISVAASGCLFPLLNHVPGAHHVLFS